MLKKKILLKISFCFLIALVFNELKAQSRFKGGVVGGFNAAQLNGDNSAGYNKVGFNAGIRALIDLGGRWEMSTDILLSQRGSRTSEREALVTRSCTLNYLEVPVLFNVRDWLRKSTNEGSTYYKASFSAGLVYARLFKATSNIPFLHTPVINKFSNHDVGFMGGINFFFNEHWVVTWRYGTSFTKVFNPAKYPNDALAQSFLPLRNHHLSFQTAWIF